MSVDLVLDVGCGTGALLSLSHDRGHQGRLVGLDPATGMLDQARKQQGVEWLQGDINTVRFDSQFDLIVMSGHAFQVLVGDIVRFSHTFSSVGWDRPKVSRSTLRFLDVESLSNFLSMAGLVVEQQHGDWAGGKLTDDSVEIITIAKRA